MLKTVSSVANALGALNYKGTWDAATNTPTLASGVGTQGDYYVVSVAGTTDLDGITNWGVGDWAAFNGSVWQRVEGGADGNFVNLDVTGTATFDGDLGVNIGTSTPTTYVEVMTNGATGDDDFVNLTRLTYGNVLSLSRSSGDAVIQANRNLILRCDSGNNQTGANTNIIFQYDGSTESARFDASGNLAFTSGNGIDFSATAGTGTSELFDDYEEGTWNPVYVPQVGSFATMTMNISNAKYTKVGRFVYVQASILTDSVDITGGSGGLRLSGFPFASSGFGSFVISYAQAWGGDVPLYGYIENASTYANLRYRTSVNGADSAMLVSDLTNGATANQNYMIISGVYTA